MNSSRPSSRSLRESLSDKIEKMEQEILNQISRESSDKPTSNMNPGASVLFGAQDLLSSDPSEEATKSKRRKRRKKKKRTSKLVQESSEEIDVPSDPSDLPKKLEEISSKSENQQPLNVESVQPPTAVPTVSVQPPPPAPANSIGDWTRYYDDHFQHFYFYNHKTGVTTWEEPPGVSDDARMTPAHLFASMEEQSVPNVCWIQFRDPYGFYYRNPLTGDVTVQRPRNWKPYQEQESRFSERRDTRVSHLPVSNEPPPVDSRRPTAARLNHSILSHGPDRKTDIPLWIRHRDPRHGHYFENSKTGEITWQEPPSPYLWTLSHSQSQSFSRPTSPRGITQSGSFDDQLR